MKTFQLLCQDYQKSASYTKLRRHYLAEIQIDFEGAKKVTCKEATQLQKDDKVRKVWYRYMGILSKDNPDNDPALVWMIDEQK